MRRAWLMLAAAGCAFSPSPLAPASSPDAAVSVIDAAPAVADAPVELPDGGACAVRTRPLALGVSTIGTLGGPSRYEASCAGGATGAEQIYELDVTGAASVDLVVDVIDSQPPIDSVIEVTSDCRGGEARCVNRGRAGSGEVLIDEGVATGRHFVAVDTLSGSGSYAVTAFLRGIVVEGAVCSRDLTASRCRAGAECLDLEGDGVGACEVVTPVAEGGGDDDTPCAATRTLTADAVFTGEIASPTDVDVVALRPPADRDAHILLHDGAGGCPADLALELLLGDACATAIVTSSDDNGGLGPCPLLEATVPGGVISWLRVSPATGAPGVSGAEYVLVVDF